MFTDIVGYSALTQRNEALALELLEEHRRLLREWFPRFNGREVETIGDGFLVEFSSALEATQAAVEIQRALTGRNQLKPTERCIRLRIGIHVGDVVHRDGKVMGDAVNIAARIEPLAEAGGICLSRSVFDQVANKLDAALVKLSSPELKNIQMPMEVYRVVLPWDHIPIPGPPGQPPIGGPGRNRTLILAAATLLILTGLGWWFFHNLGSLRPRLESGNLRPSPLAAHPKVKKSVAVSTFVNLSPDPADEYLAGGITVQIFDELIKISGLRVIPARDQEVRKKAGELGVNALLEGSVRKEGSQLRITAHLQNLSDGSYIWSHTYDYAMTNILEMQSEVAQRVAAALQVQLGPDEIQQFARRPTGDPEAYRLYIAGRSHWNKYTEEGWHKSIEYYNQAIKIDLNFALAYSGLADSWIQLGDGEYTPPKEAFAKAREFVRQALELDPDLGPAYVSRGTVRIFYTYEWPEAEADFKEALRLSPKYADLYHFYGHYFEIFGRTNEAIATFQKGLALDPLSPVLPTELAGCYYHARQYQKAEELCRTAIGQNPTFAWARNTLAFVLIQQGRFQEALALLAEVRRLEGGDIHETVAQEAYALGLSGRKDLARERLIEFRALSVKSGVLSSYFLAMIHMALGEEPEALNSLGKAREKGETWMAFIAVDPIFQPLQSDARFQRLLRSIGLIK